MRYPRACILIFGRLPVPGSCKTRLIPELGAQNAAALQAWLLRNTVRRISESRLADAQLWLAGSRDHPLVDEFRDATISVRFQRGDDLGERMANAVGEARKQYAHVVLIGTDCPAMDADYLQDALQRLERGAELVLGPAEDGGYVLLGTSCTGSGLFAQIDWGSGLVLDQTLQRAASMAIEAEMLSPLFDIDRPEDYVRAIDEGWIAPLT